MSGNRPVWSGLIGRTVVTTLARSSSTTVSQLPYTWLHQITPPDNEKGTIRQAILEDADTIGRIDIVWTAGKAGFGAGDDEMEQETGRFEEIVRLSTTLRSRVQRVATCYFHFVSSAGGLFEGQRFVDALSTPRPLRPYGKHKLGQEARLCELDDSVHKKIYRPSSVYGVGGRTNLINALIRNSWQHLATEISGAADTLRDYVFAPDVGSFIASRLGEEHPGTETHLLVTGRPVSVEKVITSVERLTRRALYLKFDSRPTNARHISFVQSAKPRNWQTTDLETGIAFVLKCLSETFSSGRPRTELEVR